MDRSVVNDKFWSKLAPLLPGKKGDPGRSGFDNRMFVEAVLYSARTGLPWRDLPEEFGQWNSVYRRFCRWSDKGIWELLFVELAKKGDFKEVSIDSTAVRVHQHGAGAEKKNGDQALGRSRRGLTTKLHTLTEGQGATDTAPIVRGWKPDWWQCARLSASPEAHRGHYCGELRDG